MNVVLNLETDLARRLCREVDPCGALFASLPVDVQLRKLAPVLREQQARDRQKLGTVRRKARNV